MRLIIRGVFWFGLYTFIVLLAVVIGAVVISRSDSADFTIALAGA